MGVEFASENPLYLAIDCQLLFLYVLDNEFKLKSWPCNTPLYLQLQWFDTVERVTISEKLKSRRWTTEITSRDELYLQKLGVTIS